MVVLKPALRDVAARQNDGRLYLRMQAVGSVNGLPRWAGAVRGHVLNHVLARRQHGTPRSSGEGSILVVTLLSQLATALSALAPRAAAGAQRLSALARSRSAGASALTQSRIR